MLMAQTTQTNLATPESVPIGWELSKVGSLVKRVNEKRGDIEPEPIILSCSKDHGLIPQLELFKRRVAALDTRRYKLVGNGDFVYDPNLLWSGAISRSRQQAVGIVSPVYEVFRVDPGSSQDFLHAWFMAPSRLPNYRAISMGTNVRRRRADFGDFCKLSILLPPLPEQRGIAAVLDSIDEAIKRTDAVIAATERLRDALLHELLTRGVPGWHTEWKEVPGIGTIPADWEVVRLGDATEVASGQFDPKEPRFQKLLFVAPNDIESATGRLVTRRTVADARAISGKYRFDQYDVLYSKIRPYLNKVHLPNEPGLCSADMYPLRPLRALDRTYLALTLLSPKFTAYTRTCSDRTGIPKINRPDLLRYSLALPPLREQLIIAEAFNGVDHFAKRMREERDGLQSLKNSMREALLTAKIRMPTDRFWVDG